MFVSVKVDLRSKLMHINVLALADWNGGDKLEESQQMHPRCSNVSVWTSVATD